MQPFADVTYGLEGDQNITISEVIPQLMELENHLNEKKQQPGCKKASEELLVDMKNCFSYVLDHSSATFEPVYVVATALDPRWALVLNRNLTDAAEAEIIRLLSMEKEGIRIEEPPLENNDNKNESGSSCRFKYVSALIQQKQQLRSVSHLTHGNKISDELSTYFKSAHRLPLQADSLIFWNDCKETYPNLAILAQNVLIIPATSVPVERLFSQASIAAGGKRNRLSGEQLEKEVMLKTNKRFF